MTLHPHPTHTKARWLLLAAAVICAMLPSKTAAQANGKYTESRPLVIMCDWEFPPYEYRNNQGEPDGFNVEVLHTILKEMGIPHQFVMKEWDQAAKAFEKHQADLILDPVFHYRTQPYYASRSILCYYKLKIASCTDAPIIHSFSQLSKTQSVVLKSNDIATKEILAGVVPDLNAVYHSPNDALAGVANGRYTCFIWGEEPLKWTLKELNLEDIRLNELDIPAGEMHMVGYDKDLIDELDDQFARLEQSGQLEKLHIKWFRPEEMQDDASPVAIYITLAVILLSIVLFLFNTLMKKRVKNATLKVEALENMMRQAIGMTQYNVFLYDVQTQRFTNRHGYILPPEGASVDDFMQHVHPDNRQQIKDALQQLVEGRITTSALDLQFYIYSTQEHVIPPGVKAPLITAHGHAMAEAGSDGRTRYVYCIAKDFTSEVRKEQGNSELASRYTKIFDTSLIAMSFYDADGTLLDLNQNMRELCGFDDEGEKYFRKMRFFDNPYFRDQYDPKSHEQFFVCQHMHYPELGINKYIEFRLLPVIGENDEIIYYTITARDVTDERNMNIEQRKHDKQLHEANGQVSAYEQQLQYLLERSDMFVWNFDLATRHIKFSRSLSKIEFSVPREEYMQWMVESEREGADRNLVEDMMKGKNFNTIHHFYHTPANDSPCWYALSGIPTFNAAGHPTGYMGIARDITKLMMAQEKLKKERKRADESGKLKSVFLANMTHEIRTPLNAIVGFSDLLQVIDDPTDRHEFIRIIRNNCDMLLRLINDIIEASNMNQGPILIEASDVDFATAFNDICQTLAQRVQEPDVAFVVDNPYTSFPTHIDKGRMQQVITNFTTNAVKYTRKGHIKVGYSYLSFSELKERVQSKQLQDQWMPFSGIFMYCEDTGAGIPQEKQDAVFERFVKLNDYVQGTGLGLSICTSIADRCGGRIGVISEGEGHGSTFWIWIPCQLKGS